MQFLENKGGPAATTHQRGQAAEDVALAYLQGQGLWLMERNYRTPGRGGGEIDLICRTAAGTVVFVEVRARKNANFGGAAASIGYSKRRRIVLAAQFWLLHQRPVPACRFDVVVVQGTQVQWLQGAFDGSTAY